MSEDQEKYGKDAPERFADSQQQEAWRAYACAAMNGMASSAYWENNMISEKEMAPVVEVSCLMADMLMAEEMKRARAR